MNFENNFYELPKDKIATVVTSLEMFEKPLSLPEPCNKKWTLRLVDKPDVEWYRDLYRSIGQDWLWFQRILMADEDLRSILHDTDVEVRVLEVDGNSKGILELDYRNEGEGEIAFLGLTADLTGKGAGSWLMKQALEMAWLRPVKRLWIHTCTLDHPRALPFYIRSGFVPFKRELEIADDPRVIGKSPRDSAPHFPLIG